MGEKCKISIRNIRREANDELKKMQKNKEIGEDDLKKKEKIIQSQTDDNINKIDEKIISKEKRNNDNMNPLKHVGIIMDGNGRWGIKHYNSRNAGHKEGLKTVEMVIKESIKNDIKYLTLYAFSTENWKRPLKERKFLFKLLQSYLIEKLEEFNNEKIKLKILGKKNFTAGLNKLLLSAENKTKQNKDYKLI